MTQPVTGQDREQILIGRLRNLREEEQSVEDGLVNMQSQQVGDLNRPNGAAVAATLSAAIGVLAIGVLTSLAEASQGIGSWLN